jgi:spore germination protein YaaH
MPVRRPLLAVLLALAVVGLPSAPRPGAGVAFAQGNTPLAPGAVAKRQIDVFGYLPYWEIDAKVDAYLRYDVLSTIALFGVAFRPDGSFNTADPSYRTVTGSTAAAIIAHAHAAGVRVVMTFESFNADRNAQFLEDPQAQSTFIGNALALISRLGIDGANVDIEGLSGTYFDEYGTFVGALRQAVLGQHPGGEVTVATNANASGAKMAAAAVANGADRAFIMGYAYRSAGSNPVGSVDPLVTASGLQNLTWTLDQYAAAGVPAKRLVLGLPLYGRTWPTVSTALGATRQPAATYGGGGAFYPKDLPDAAAGATITYDPVEQSAVLIGWNATDRTWTQTYYDDPAALAPKLQLALRRGLAGVGLWALGYDRGQPGYWQVLASLHRGLEISRIGVTPYRTRAGAVTVTIGWKSAGHAVTAMRLSNDGTTWSAWRRASATTSWAVAAGQDGARTVYVQVRDSSGALSTIRPVSVVLDRHGPTMTTLTLAWSASSGKWVSTYRATDVSGVAAYQFRSRVGAGAWHLLPRGPNATVVRIGALRSAHVTVMVRARDSLGMWSAWKTVSAP